MKIARKKGAKGIRIVGHNKKLLWIILMLAVALAAVIIVLLNMEDFENASSLIGGQRDKHGCLGPAGYSYNETIKACVREWELNSEQEKAAGIAVEYAKFSENIGGIERDKLTVIEVNKVNKTPETSEECRGCFLVKLQDTKYNTAEISLESWSVVISVSKEN